MNDRMLEKIIQGLPTSPGILGRERFFNSAVLIPFVDIDGVCHLLFQKRAENIRQGSEICFPGGMFDAGKDRDLKDTAIRETFEEMGIAPDRIDIQGQMDTLVAAAGATVDSFPALVDIRYPEDIQCNKDEVEKTFLIPLQYFAENRPETYKVRVEIHPSYTNKKGETVTLLPAAELGLPDRYLKPWGGLQHRVLVYQTDEGPLWGLTAEIVHALTAPLVAASD